MNNVSMKGKSLEEAIRSAAEVFGVGEDKISYRVIHEGKAGVLGVFGGEEAEIEAWIKKSKANYANDVMQEILNKMGLLAIADIARDDEEGIEINIKGEDLGQIIGKDGLTLMAMQTVMSSILRREYGEKANISIDAGGYKEKQKMALERLAQSAADDVISSGQEKVLPPMTAGERRIVHIYLKNNGKLKTESQGEGRDRRLIISLK
ncbi:MAG: spoIIIJ-associated protein [Candidatus Saganbacteria bacterium]|uniref:RNA-binding protein KhpB n=1 Tax=Candidatus Saganbacteria bacterium TaxID=2575572 RepID=A0A833L1Y6_UNCSA|nr:MAG: spoIIIJ-associated protein [Candidatus Saganbacteria bacterium]